jgi:hypothetical protein
MIQALPIKTHHDPIVIKGKKYFVIGTKTDDDGDVIDTIKSEQSGAIKTFKRSIILKNIEK